MPWRNKENQNMRTIKTQKDFIAGLVPAPWPATFADVDGGIGGSYATKAEARQAHRLAVKSAAVAKRVDGGIALFSTVDEYRTWSAQA